jgi:hypothetical protein
MSLSQNATQLEAVTRSLDNIVSAVIARGFDDEAEPIDDYSTLLAAFEQRKLVIFQLYDSYFPPKRHEFELDLVTSVVDAVIKNPTVAFVGGAVAGGVIGNAAYDVLKFLLSGLIVKLKPIKRSHDAFKEIQKNSDQIIQFFQTRNQAGITEISESLNTDPEKVEPLLKLLGFRCRRKGKRRIWFTPHNFKSKQTHGKKSRDS